MPSDEQMLQCELLVVRVKRFSCSSLQRRIPSSILRGKPICVQISTLVACENIRKTDGVANWLGGHRRA